jgi:hypothetical protein
LKTAVKNGQEGKAVDRKNTSSKSLFIVVTLLFSMISVLVILRLHAARLETVRNDLDRQYASFEAEERELKLIYFELASPTKIYSYCKDILGMNKAQNVEMIRITAPRVAAVPASNLRKNWRSSLFSLFGFTVN